MESRSRNIAENAEIADKLGEFADRVEKRYRNNTLEEFAEAIEIDYDTLKDYRTTHRAWRNSPVKPRNYSLAKALASYKDRDWYIQEWPNATEKEAREDIRRWKKEAREKKESETVDAERKGFKGRPDTLKKRIIKTADAFFSESSKEREAIDLMATYYTNRISWTDYSDMWDALEAARRRARDAMDKLDLIISPNLAREADDAEQEANADEEPKNRCASGSAKGGRT